jgi:cell division septation protein DedD
MILSALWAKVGKYVVALGAILAAVAAIFLKGRSSGEEKQQAKVDEAMQKAQEAEQVQQVIEVRHDVDTTVQNLPQAPTQAVATANPSSAAGKLHDDWSR